MAVGSGVATTMPGLALRKKSRVLKRAARAEVEDDVLGLELADLAQEPELPVVVQVGDEEDVLGAADDRAGPR